MYSEKAKNNQSISVLNDSELIFSITPLHKHQNPDLSNTIDIDFLEEEEYGVQQRQRGGGGGEQDEQEDDNHYHHNYHNPYNNKQHKNQHQDQNEENKDENRNDKQQSESRSKLGYENKRMRNEDILEGAFNRRALFMDTNDYCKNETDSVINSPLMNEPHIKSQKDTSHTRHVNKYPIQLDSINLNDIDDCIDDRVEQTHIVSLRKTHSIVNQNSSNHNYYIHKPTGNGHITNTTISIISKDSSHLPHHDQILQSNSKHLPHSQTQINNPNAITNHTNHNNRNNNNIEIKVKGQVMSEQHQNTQLSEFDNNEQYDRLFGKQENMSKKEERLNKEENESGSGRRKKSEIIQFSQQQVANQSETGLNSQYQFKGENRNLSQYRIQQILNNQENGQSEDQIRSQNVMNISLYQSQSEGKGKTILEDITNDRAKQLYTPSNRQRSPLHSVYSKMNLLRLTNKFIDLLKRNSRITLFKKLKPHHIRIIDDKATCKVMQNYSHSEDDIDFQFKSSFSSINFFKRGKIQKMNELLDVDSLPYKTENILSKIVKQQLNTLQKCLNKLPTLPPDNGLILCWKFILFCSLIILIFYIPIQNSFKVFNNQFVQNMGIILLILDTIVKLNIGFFKDGYVVQQRSKILIEIFKFQLWFNIISILFLSSKQEIWQFAFLVNVFSVFNLMEKFDNYFQFKQRFFIYYEILKLVFIVCFLASTFGSLFFFISSKQVENGEQKAWILTKEIHTWVDGYIYSIYFMFITMSTVGYGDLVPQNKAEVIFVALITLLSSCVFAYCINTIGHMLSDISQRESSFKQRKKDVLQYLTNRNISRNLQTKVIRYLEYLKSVENSQSHLNAQDIMKYFSDNIKYEVNKEFFGKQLIESKVFGLHFTHSFLNSLAQTMKEITLAPGDILYSKNQIDNRILFLTSGDVELFEKQVRLRIIQKGEILNYRGFFGNLPHSSSARSLSISHFSYCTQEDLIQVLKTFPQDYESFCFMRDEMMLYNRTIDSKCCSCQSYSHTFQECPLIHYRINTDIVLRRWNFSIVNQRQSFERRKMKFKQLANLQIVKNKLKLYKISLLNKIEDYSYLQGNDMIEYLGDKEFYKQLPSIKISEDGKVYQYSDQSNIPTDQSEFSEDEMYMDQFQGKANSQLNINPSSSPKLKVNHKNSSNSSNNLFQASGRKQQDDDILTENSKILNHQPSIEFQVHASSMTFNKQSSNTDNQTNNNQNLNQQNNSNNNNNNNFSNQNVAQNNMNNMNNNLFRVSKSMDINKSNPTPALNNNPIAQVDNYYKQYKEDSFVSNGVQMQEQSNLPSFLQGNAGEQNGLGKSIDYQNQRQEQSLSRLEMSNSKLDQQGYQKFDQNQINQIANIFNYLQLQKQNSSNSSASGMNNNQNNQQQKMIIGQIAQNMLMNSNSNMTANNKRNMKSLFQQYKSYDSSELAKDQTKTRSRVTTTSQKKNIADAILNCNCNQQQIKSRKAQLITKYNSKLFADQQQYAQQLQIQDQEKIIEKDLYESPRISNKFEGQIDDKIKNDKICIMEFDLFKEFNNYYPHNNYTVVIKQLQTYLKKTFKNNRQVRRVIKKTTQFNVSTKKKKASDLQLSKYIKIQKE